MRYFRPPAHGWATEFRQACGEPMPASDSSVVEIPVASSEQQAVADAVTTRPRAAGSALSLLGCFTGVPVYRALDPYTVIAPISQIVGKPSCR